MTALPLSGIRVIDLSEVWAGPMATSILGDMGAEVIKVESFPRASMTRSLRPPPGRRGFLSGDSDDARPWELSATHNMANRNKYGITLNLAKPRGLELFKGLVRISDAVIEGYSAGTAQKLGISYQDLVQVKPDLVMVSMPGWGVQGPYQGYVTLGSGLDATSGHTSLRGYPGEAATETMPVFHSDATGAACAVFAVLSALHYRNRTGQGQWIDLSQAEAFMAQLARPILDYTMNGRVPQPLGNRDYTMAPHGCYPCRGEDRWLAISIGDDRQWQALCQVMGQPQLAHDPRFADVVSRYHHQDQLDTIIAAWTRGHDHYEAMHLLQAAGVPAAAVIDEEEAFADPHLKERDFFEEVAHPLAGVRPYPGMLWKMSKTPMHIRLPTNLVGQHNEYVLGELLGLSPQELAHLEAEGIIGTRYDPGADVDEQDQALGRTLAQP